MGLPPWSGRTLYINDIRREPDFHLVAKLFFSFFLLTLVTHSVRTFKDRGEERRSASAGWKSISIDNV